MNKDIDIRHLNWGPLVTKFTLNDSFCKELLKKGKKCVNDARHMLAGIIDKEFSYNDDDMNWFCEEFAPYLNSHMNLLNTWHNTNYDVNLKLDKLWINFMKQSEFNPLHIHTGDLSFVIYLKVPKELELENKNYKGTDQGGPGAIKFINELKNDEMCITRHSFLPKENEAFIFPASLNHTVQPFRCKKERISVSGNFHFIDKNGNNINNNFLKSKRH